MEQVNFTHSNGRLVSLRPTHALQVIAEMQDGLTSQEDGFQCDPDRLKKAVHAVRDRYRCRTVRKELRRVALLAEEEDGYGIVHIDCKDQEVMEQMYRPGN